MPPPITLTSPLPADQLLFKSMKATAGLSDLGDMQLKLLSPSPDLKPEDLLGKAITVSVEQAEGKRHFNGYVTRFALGESSGRHHQYHATVNPWLWFLTRTRDCRIFQEMSVPDIVKKVFDDHGIANFKFNTFRAYRKWTYCVQYRESDFNFVARLLEHEGIYWYFEHQEGSHKLVLVDSQSAHDAVPGHESLPYFSNAASLPPGVEYVSGWQFSREVKPGKTVLTSYDFERPSTSLEVNQGKTRKYDLSDYEIFDFQGDYLQTTDGRQLAEDRMDEMQTRFQWLRGMSNGHAIEAGRLLKLTQHPREDQNAEYLIVSTSIHASLHGSDSGTGGGDYRCEFTAIPSAQQFRPARRTAKPFVQGPQSAVVVGPSGEEIYTDKYGRVKVQFHWDRYGTKNEKSSCWVRVSHPWAGKNFGVIHTPRIGQEVIVDFFEGDPDQPVITGRVYNAEQMPPWDLPANATQSGILTRSSKGGGYANANAIRFEDKKGAEQVWIHAEKNQDIEVENDETHWVGHDRTKSVDHDEKVHVKHDRTENVDNNETITIGVDRKESVGSNETITIGKNRTEKVGIDEKITIGANRTESVGANENITIGANRSVSVGSSETKSVAMQRTHTVGINETIAIGAAQEVAIGAAQTITVGAIQSVSVGASQSVSVGAGRSISVGAALSTSVGANETRKVSGDRGTSIAGTESTTVGKGMKLEIAEDFVVSVGKKLSIGAADEIVIKTGSASITMKKDGTIQIKGKDIILNASGDVTAKASSNMVLKGGSKVTVN